MSLSAIRYLPYNERECSKEEPHEPKLTGNEECHLAKA